MVMCKAAHSVSHQPVLSSWPRSAVAAAAGADGRAWVFGESSCQKPYIFLYFSRNCVSSTSSGEVQETGEGQCQQVRASYTGGEALPMSTAQNFHERLPHSRLHNLYGPTEATVDVTGMPTAPAHHRCPELPCSDCSVNRASRLHDWHLLHASLTLLVLRLNCSPCVQVNAVSLASLHAQRNSRPEPQYASLSIL